MAQPLIQPSFAAGELAPAILGRVDLAKFRTGCAVLRNFFVDYRGGVSSRPGTLAAGLSYESAAAGNHPPRLLPFQFSVSQSYILELSGNGVGMRIISDGNYVLEDAITITGITNAVPPVVTTSAAHNYAQGDTVWIEDVVGMDRPNGLSGVNGRFFSVGPTPGTDTFSLYTPASGFAEEIDSTSWTTYVSGGDTSRVYTVAIPWEAADFYALNYAQSNDVMTVVHPNYPPYDISRLAATDWTITEIVVGGALDPPTNIEVTGLTTGSAISAFSWTYAYTITTVNTNANQESEAAAVAGVLTVQYVLDGEQSFNTVSWDTPSSGTGNAYNVYKAVPVPANTSGPPYFWGRVATVYTNNWVDTNIDPDFSLAPPQDFNPFSTGPIASVTVIFPGRGYLDPVVDVIPNGTGSGGEVAASANSQGQITGATVSVPGDYQTPPTLIVRDNNTLDGSGGVATVTPTWIPWPGPGNPPGTPSGTQAIWTIDPETDITITNTGTNYHLPFVKVTGSGAGGNVLFGTQLGQYEYETNHGAIGPFLDTIDELYIFTSDTNEPGGGFTLTPFVEDNGPNNQSGQEVAGLQAILGGTNYPGCVAYFDQRRYFGASTLNPDTFWGSKPGDYTNFDTSFPSSGSDAVSGTLVSQELNAINSMTAMSSGLIMLTSGGAFQVSGGAVGAAVTPTSITAQAQAFSGANPLQPLRIGYDLVYVQARGSAVRDLSYNFYVNVYTGTDISLLSSHLFYGRQLVSWAYAEEPFKIVWGVRDDGVMLSLTYLKEQEIYGWARHDTAGFFRGVAVIPENGQDTAYVVVERPIGGDFFYMTERIQPRLFGQNLAQNIPSNPELSWSMDAAAQSALVYPAQGVDSGAPSAQGQIFSAVISDGGTGYSDIVFAEIVGDDNQGSGAQLAVTATGGVITGVTVVNPGSGYVNPRVLLNGSGGTGAVLSLRVVNPWTLICDVPIGDQTPGNVGDVVRISGGKGTVLTVTDNQTLLVDMEVEPAGFIANVPTLSIIPAASGEWTCTPQISVVAGLDQLNGCVVQILADGEVLAPQVVVDGCVTLDNPASLVLAGLGFSAQMQTMPLDVGGDGTVQGRRKTLAAVTMRCIDTRGISVGPDFRSLTNVKQRDFEDYGHDTDFMKGGGQQAPAYENAPLSPVPWKYVDRRSVLEAAWTLEGQLCLQQDYPLPVTVLADIVEAMIGDTPS